ncbi:MAG TPA: coproporphyrinogen-III oxidase family protein [Gemmatimonadaceae bacterium]|nr:coproporphyrinogen-III oxidase family protein [Gemmatimonadaceae bacterium]
MLPLPRHVYIHVPFCARRCSYCDFAIAVRRSTPVAEYLAALDAELAAWLARGGELGTPRGARSTEAAGTLAGRTSGDTRTDSHSPAGGAPLPVDHGHAPWEISTLYLGGGTPSRLGADGVAAVMDLVRSRAAITFDAEITIEVNPDDASPAAARAWREAGITRVSIGAQSFDDDVLRWMHRTHDARQIAAAVDTLRQAGLANLSLDLIFALPNGVERDWDRDLHQAIALEPSHLSLYGLTIEPFTPLGRRRDRGLLAEAPEERYEREFLRAHDVASAAGFEHYEVSNFARSGNRSRHNSSYWQRVPYAGLGPSAHSFDGTRRGWNASGYVEWCRLLAEGRSAVAGVEDVGEAERHLEEAYLGLRTDRGLHITPERHAEIAPWLAAGWARLDGSRLTLTPAGWLRLDSLAGALTEHGSRLYV